MRCSLISNTFVNVTARSFAPSMALSAALSMAVPLGLGTLGCATTPSIDDRKMAAGNYEVALAFVHEAEKNGATGNATEQDAKYREALRELLEAEKTGGMV